MVKNPPSMQETWVRSLGWEGPFREGHGNPLEYSWTSLVAQMVKNQPAIQVTQVRFLGWEDPLEKGMAIHSSILAWRIPWTEEPGGLQSMRLQRASHDRATKHTRTTLQGTAIE